MQMGEYKKKLRCLNGRSLNAPTECLSALPPFILAKIERLKQEPDICIVWQRNQSG